MPTDDFPKHVTYSPFAHHLRPLPLPTDVELQPWLEKTHLQPLPVTDWSGMNPMPVTVTPKEPLEPYYNMVALDQPTYFETVFAESLKRLAEARASEQVAVWLEEIIADPQGRKLVQDILDRKAEAFQKLVVGVDPGADTDTYVTASIEDGVIHVIDEGRITNVSVSHDGMGTIMLGGAED